MHRTVSHRTVCRPSRLAWLALLGALIALAGTPGRAQQGQGRARRLFEPRGQAVADAPDGRVDRTRKRGRRVRANADALRQADTAGGNDILTLNLFDDVQLRARQSRIERTRSGGTVWKGTLLDVAGEATFAVTDGVIAGTIFAGDKVFEVLYAGRGEHEVREIEPSAFPTDDPHLEVAPVEPDPQASLLDAALAADALAGDSASVIDLLVVWTPAARAAAGGASAVQSLVDLAVANTNTAYANSAVAQRLRLVYAGEVSYTESGISADLSRIAATSDGSLDTVHALRDTHGADVVTLLGNGYTSAGYCGIGYLMASPSTGFASNAFNVVDRACIAGNLTLAHELGHNMGLHHDPANASGAGAYSYAYGYQHPAGLFRTIMAYACPSGPCARLTHFSNPSVSYNGMPTGTASQNNALALNNTALSVANFRQAAGGSTCSYSLGSTSISVGSGSATGSFAVNTTSGCSWTASSSAPWLSVTGGASGTGSGSVSFSVAANTGPLRSGPITVNGRTFTVTQAAAACGAFTVSPTSQSASAAGGNFAVIVTGIPGCPRTAVSVVDWISITGGSVGSGSGTVNYRVAANPYGTARTRTITVAGQTVTISQVPVAAPPLSSPIATTAAKGDFTGDFRADLLWRRDDGLISLWAMNGLTAVERKDVQVTAPVWKIVGTGDLNGDGKPEIIWQHVNDGWLCAWFMNGEALQQSLYLNPNRITANAWKIVAVADMNGDSKADLVWQHDQGWLAIWYMNGINLTSDTYLSPNYVSGSDWKIVGAGDVNGDKKPDLIWQHESAGWLSAWLMNGATLIDAVYLTPNQIDGDDWKIRAVVDLNGDGHTDLVWQHESGGWVAAWLMNGTTATSTPYLQPNNVSSAWRLVGPR